MDKAQRKAFGAVLISAKAAFLADPDRILTAAVKIGEREAALDLADVARAEGWIADRKAPKGASVSSKAVVEGENALRAAFAVAEADGAVS